MGYYIFDKFSLLHFSVGIVWNYYNLNLVSLIVLHLLFEYIENTKYGMSFINNYFTLWPGGKSHADSLINSLSDTVFSILGWIFYEKYSKNWNPKYLAIIFGTNILFYWLSNLQIMIFTIIVSVIFYKNLNYILCIIGGLLLGYAVSFIDYKLRLFS